MKKIFIVTVPVLLFVLQASGCTRSDSIPPGGVYRSESAGASFEQSVTLVDVDEEDEIQHVAEFTLGKIFRDLANPNRILVSAYDNGIIISEDDGQTWRVIKTPLRSTTDVLVLDNGVLVASGTDEAGQGFVIRSLDDGLGWDTVLTVPVPVKEEGFRIIQGAPVTASVVLSLELDPFNPNRVYAGSNLGTVFVGEQSAKVWRTIFTLQEDNLVGTQQNVSLAITKLVPSPHVAGEFLFTTTDKRLFRINPAGEKTEIKIPQQVNRPESILAVGQSKEVLDVTLVNQFPDALIVGVEDGVVVTRDNGQTWLQLPVPIEVSQEFNTAIINVSPTNPNRLLFVVNEVVYRSEDGGNTWNTFSIGATGRVISDLSINPSNAGKVLLVTRLLRI